MHQYLQDFEQVQQAKFSKKAIPNFTYGDTIKVNVVISEGGSDRIQAFEGLCIARRNKGSRSSFVVRKISYNKGIERIFPLFSPKIDSIEIVKKGVVRRAKLYYMRELRGKAARITEKRDYSRDSNDTVDTAPEVTQHGTTA